MSWSLTSKESFSEHRNRERMEKLLRADVIRLPNFACEDPKEHLTTLLETAMHQLKVREIVIHAPTPERGREYGRLFVEWGLEAHGFSEPYYPERDETIWGDTRHYWVTAETTDGRVLAVRWPQN